MSQDVSQVTTTSNNVIVDTGCANLSSVKFAVERFRLYRDYYR